MRDDADAITILNVDDQHVTFRYVPSATATRGPNKSKTGNVVIDQCMEADGPHGGDWIFNDTVRTAAIHRSRAGEYFLDVGDDETLRFRA